MEWYFQMNEILPSDQSKKRGGLYLGGAEPAKNIELIK